MLEKDVYLTEHVFLGNRSVVDKTFIYGDCQKKVDSKSISLVNEKTAYFQFYSIDDNNERIPLSPLIFNGVDIDLVELRARLREYENSKAELLKQVQVDLESKNQLIISQIWMKKASILDFDSKIKSLRIGIETIEANSKSRVCKTPWEDYMIMPEGSITIEEHNISIVKQIQTLVLDNDSTTEQISEFILNIKALCSQAGLTSAGFETVLDLLRERTSRDNNIATLASELCSRSSANKDKGSK